MTFYPGELESILEKWRKFINCSGHDPEQKVLTIEVDRLRAQVAASTDVKEREALIESAAHHEMAWFAGESALRESQSAKASLRAELEKVKTRAGDLQRGCNGLNGKYESARLKVEKLRADLETMKKERDEFERKGIDLCHTFGHDRLDLLELQSMLLDDTLAVLGFEASTYAPNCTKRSPATRHKLETLLGRLGSYRRIT